MRQMVVHTWEYPQELLRLEELPHVMRGRSGEEVTLAAIGLELRRQHELLMMLVDLASGGGTEVPIPGYGVEVSESGG